MNRYSLKELAERLNYIYSGNCFFSSVSIDTRTLKPGDLFVTIKGENFDGHIFIDKALSLGACAVVSENSLPKHIPHLQVNDCREFLGRFASLHRETLGTYIFGITGSVGKTTTKTMLASILRVKYRVLAPEASMNNDIGLPLTLLQLRPEHDYAVIEMGTNHFGEIEKLTKITRPDMVTITNIGPAHLEYFKDLSGVARAKAEIFAGLKSSGKVVLNQNDAFFDFFREYITDKSIITFGTNSEADIKVEHIKLNADLTANFNLLLKNQCITITLNVLGEHNVFNALAASTCAYFAGIEAVDIKTGLESMQPVTKRLLKKSGINGALILDDSYSAIPNAVIAALNVLAQSTLKKIFVFGGMAELNPEEDVAWHRQIGEYAKKIGINYLLTLNPKTQETIAAFGHNSFYFTSKTALISALKELLDPQTIVLVKGSRGAKMEEVVAAIIH